MKVTLVVDGETREVEVDLAGGTAVIAGRTFPIQVLSSGPSRVELEVDGERVVVEGWFEGAKTPEEPVTVGGELHRVRADVALRAGRASAAPAAPGPKSAPAATPAASPVVAGGAGTAIVPPMPGKVVELRVKDGDRVVAGQVLLVLEAMKMRNEVASPIAGRVAELRVQAGANVRAREPMLRVVPD